jgi:Domain of unknown function (DUF4878)
MKKIIFIIACFCTITLTNCKSSSSTTPELTLQNFFDALSKNDTEKARLLCTVESKNVIDILDLTGYMSNKNNATDKFNATAFEIGVAVINEDIATVPVKEKTSGITLQYQLRKVAGVWKVVFDTDTVMKIFTDGAASITNNSMDSLNKAFKNIKNMSIDSIKMGLEKGKQVMDSIQKLLDKQ